MRPLIHSLSGHNNLVPVHFGRRETMPKHEKVSKDFTQDCTMIIQNFIYDFGSKIHFNDKQFNK